MPDGRTAQPTPRWRDPLFSPGDRFPLGPPEGVWSNGWDEPSESGARPFSLRGVVEGPSIEPPASWPYRYCPERQITLVVDGAGATVPLLKHTKPGPTADTSGTTDGKPGEAPPEEMRNTDYQTD